MKNILWSAWNEFCGKVQGWINASNNNGDIASGCMIPRSTVFCHKGLGVVIAKGTKLGENCMIYQHVTLGGRASEMKGYPVKNRGSPVIGNNVTIYNHASVLGGITVGDNCVVGAYSLVLDDVPANSVVYGIPARVVRSL
jgi:serine O-acetyltransferase